MSPTFGFDVRFHVKRPRTDEPKRRGFPNQGRRFGVSTARTQLYGQGMTESRKPTVEEAEAILTLVRGGWLRLELTLDESVD